MPATTRPAPKTIQEAFGPAGTLFPVGFEGVSLDWTASDLIKNRPWVSNEGDLAPHLSYMYREAAYGVATGQQNNKWLIENKIFGVVEYHFQRDNTGKPIGPLYKVVFIFEVRLPKEAVAQIREAGSSQWGEMKTAKDDFGLEFNQWSTPEADIHFYYSPSGAIAESIEIIHKDLAPIKYSALLSE
jgi:hypothetical protein